MTQFSCTEGLEASLASSNMLENLLLKATVDKEDQSVASRYFGGRERYARTAQSMKGDNAFSGLIIRYLQLQKLKKVVLLLLKRFCKSLAPVDKLTSV